MLLSCYRGARRCYLRSSSLQHISSDLTIYKIRKIFTLEFPLIFGEQNAQILLHINLVIDIVNFISELLHYVKNVREERINHHMRRSLIAERTQPPLVLRVHLNIGLKIKALKMGANFSSGWNRNWEHSDRVGQIDRHLFSFLVFHFCYFIVPILTTEKVLVPPERICSLFCSLGRDEVYDIMRLEYLNQKYGDDVAWVIEKPFVVFLSLKHVY